MEIKLPKYIKNKPCFGKYDELKAKTWRKSQKKLSAFTTNFGKKIQQTAQTAQMAFQDGGR